MEGNFSSSRLSFLLGSQTIASKSGGLKIVKAFQAFYFIPFLKWVNFLECFNFAIHLLKSLILPRSGLVTNIPANMVVDQFGMIGLLTFIRAGNFCNHRHPLHHDYLSHGVPFHPPPPQPYSSTFSAPLPSSSSWSYEIILVSGDRPKSGVPCPWRRPHHAWPEPKQRGGELLMSHEKE